MSRRTELPGGGAGQHPGLSSAEAAARLASEGPNELPRARRAPLWQLVLGQVRDPLVVVLLVAAVLTLATGDWTDAGVILLVITVNTIAGVTQEVKAGQAIAALSELTGPEARVLRDGGQVVIPAAEVVPGDLLVLAEGDIVPADADVTEAAALLVDEAALTGESVPVEKTAVGPESASLESAGPESAGPESAGRELADPVSTSTVSTSTVSAGSASVSMVSAGTTVVRGRGLAVVTATGRASAMGRIAALMGERRGLTPLQRRLAGVGRVLALVAVLLSVVVLIIGLARGQGAELMVVTAISLVVAAVPESLPAVVTLALALGARRMSARNALIRRLPAVETLGSVTILATDKTGTLTEGSMVVRRLWTPDAGGARVSGSGYSPDGAVTPDGTVPPGGGVPPGEGLPPGGTVTADGAAGGALPESGAIPAGSTDALAALLAAGALCNDAALRPPEDGQPDWSAVGDPTEGALLAAAAKLGLDQAGLRTRFPRVGEVPFDSGRKRMTTVHRLPDGGFRVICKGAPEVLLSERFITGDAAALARAASHAEELAGDGYRVLAVADATVPEVPGMPQAPDAAVTERGLRLLGLTAILDPPRQAAAATIAACRQAGITPVLITGDHPATASAIARELGIIDAGDAVADCRTDAGRAAFATARVFARATPEQKLSIIAARQAAGDVVAMTGDGVNDGPALRRADIGVAMGRRGTEVARQAADLVLADDDLATVVAAAEEGRRVYANIRRFLLYGLSGGSAEIAVMLIGPLVGLALPLLPAQILWVNLLTHGLPGVALGSEPADPAAMRCPPRPPAESVLGAGLWQRIIRVGAVIAAVTLGVALWGHATGRPWQTMAFFALGTTQLAVALGSRARPGTLTNPALLWAVAGAMGLQFAAVYLPFLDHLLKTQPLTAVDLLVVFALSTLGYAAIRLDRVVYPDGQWRPGARSHGSLLMTSR